jgi:hypothetical protein
LKKNLGNKKQGNGAVAGENDVLSVYCMSPAEPVTTEYEFIGGVINQMNAGGPKTVFKERQNKTP